MIALKNKMLLAVMATLLSTVSSFAMQYHVESKDPINEQETFEQVAAKGMTLVEIVTPQDRGGHGFEHLDRPRISYLPGVMAAKEDYREVKDIVIGSEQFSYNNDLEGHQETFAQRINRAYEGSPLQDCRKNQLQEMSLKLFKVSQNQLAGSHDRGEYFPDDQVVGGVFTFKYNNNRQVSLFIKNLEVVLPLYQAMRAGNFHNWNAYTPLGKNLTAHQKNTVMFLNRLLSEKPANRFKSGVLYRMQHPEESSENLWSKLFAQPLQNSVLALPAVQNVEDAQNKYGAFYTDYETISQVQRLINTAPMEDVYGYADYHGISREKVSFINQYKTLLTFEKYMGLLNPFYGTYEQARQVHHLINTASWERVYEQADRNGISREVVSYLNQNRLGLILKNYMIKTNPFYHAADKAEHVRYLINKASWQQVFDFADGNDVSREEVGYINQKRVGLNLNEYMEKTNPFYAPYEQAIHVQYLINTASWERVYEYADAHGVSREKLTYINKNRGVKTYSLSKLQDMN